ncbi:hypothetical protein NC652_022130 [Populus alba x Populus x berolinensis]|nr:hypothetical protein NC652_022130 [Populus alba x Populus x berolinensis]
MALTHNFLLFCSLFPFFIIPSLSKTSFRPKALVLPVSKDASSLQYVTLMNQRTPLVPVKLTLDLGGQFQWVDCEEGYVSSSYKPVRCRSAQCALARSKSPRPGCNNNTCAVLPDNTVTRTATSGEVGQDVVSIQSTDGSNPGRVVSVNKLIFACSGTRFLEGLASGVKGMAGFGRTKFLIYTPLILNPVSTASVKSIKINGKAVPLNTSLLSIDKIQGTGGTKISTVNPYTVMETTIYKAVIATFVKELALVPRVASVAPFGACFNSTNIGSTRVGPPVPQIDLVLQSSKVFWRIFGANSMVQVKSDVMCLGFVDGGLNPRTSIVIGGYQLENNLLQFDLATSRLGFSSSLLFRQTTCANFNFTSNNV